MLLGSFKLRMLVVIVIATLAGLAMQSDNRSQSLVSPVLKYVMKDYGIQEKMALYLENMRGPGKGEGVPASGNITIQKPCVATGVTQHYGWYWNEDKGKQEFNAGMVLKVREGTLVRPVLSGRVDAISIKQDGRQVKVVHDNGLISIYGGLQEVLVRQGAKVETGGVLGKTGEGLYFELQNEEGPLSPETIFADT
ncbi:MAG: peptidoglycan DD-metalloendopeptidase family protein [Deltaproteobacteria bacterium]